MTDFPDTSSEPTVIIGETDPILNAVLSAVPYSINRAIRGLTEFDRAKLFTLIIKNEAAHAKVGFLPLSQIAKAMLYDAGIYDSDLMLYGMLYIFAHHLVETYTDKITEIKTWRHLGKKYYALAASLVSKRAKYSHDILNDFPDLEIEEQRAIKLLQKLANDMPFLAEALEHPVAQRPLHTLFSLSLSAISDAWQRMDSLRTISVGMNALATHAIEGLEARYNGVLALLDSANNNILRAISLGSDTILTKYTMSAMIVELANSQESLRPALDAQHPEINEAIDVGSSLIRMVNDCTEALLVHEDVHSILQGVRDDRMTPKALFATLDRRTNRLLSRMIKDAVDDEFNLALDASTVYDAEDAWDAVEARLLLLQEYFQIDLQNLIGRLAVLDPRIAGLIGRFVVYNFELYNRGADYSGDLAKYKAVLAEVMPIIQGAMVDGASPSSQKIMRTLHGREV